MNQTMTREELRAYSREVLEPHYGPLSDEELDAIHRTVYRVVALLMEWRGIPVSAEEGMEDTGA